MGGTGYPPVPPGYQPGGMGGSMDWKWAQQKLSYVLLRSARLVAARHRQVACATPAANAAPTSEFGLKAGAPARSARSSIPTPRYFSFLALAAGFGSGFAGVDLLSVAALLASPADDSFFAEAL